MIEATTTMANNDELNYPNLCSCKVELMSSTVGSKPPVKLPQDCIDVLNNVEIPVPYDFALEKMVLSKKQERDLESATLKAESREDLQNAVLVKMKSVTNADESVCVALLEDHNYDLKTSIEAFFQS